MNLSNLPDIQFAEKDPEIILNEMITGYEKAYYEQTGEQKKLYPGDPIRIWIYSQALREIQLRQIIDFSAKQNLLKYSVDGYLDNFGARYGEKGKRQKSKAAVTTMRYKLSAVQNNIIPIPLGNRTSPGNDVFFETVNYAEIPIGKLYVDVAVKCTVVGKVGNGYTANQINVLVDPIPFIESVSNLDTTQGGADVQDNESLREKIYLAPEGFSVAGPSGAYEFFAKEYLSTIADVKIDSPSPGIVDIRFILENGELPTKTLIDELQDYLCDKSRRPLTDKVQVNAPEQKSYDINLTYYIKKSNEGNIAITQNRVKDAVSEYILWQKTKIGRDIDPDELNSMIRKAGAKRVIITSPAFVPLTDAQVAKEVNINIVYGGLEND